MVFGASDEMPRGSIQGEALSELLGRIPYLAYTVSLIFLKIHLLRIFGFGSIFSTRVI